VQRPRALFPLKFRRNCRSRSKQVVRGSSIETPAALLEPRSPNAIGDCLGLGDGDGDGAGLLGHVLHRPDRQSTGFIVMAPGPCWPRSIMSLIPDVKTRLLNLIVGDVNCGEAFSRNPFPSLFS
jgi:hypothetical protein